MMGKPTIAGTRITVELILEKLGNGETFEQLLASHPRLTRPAILAALSFAAQALRADVLYPIRNQSASNLLANEGVERPIVERLRRDGHDVVYVAELYSEHYR